MAAKVKRAGLGRDFNSLFEDNLIETEKKSVNAIRISDIEPNRSQARKNFREEELASLSQSIATFGVLQPILVAENADVPGTYRIIAGERRWRASRLAGLTEIPAVVFNGDELAAAQASLVENIQRQDLSPIEEAKGFKALIDRYGMTQEALAEKIGKSRPALANAMRLLDLPEDVQQMVEDGKLSGGHARTLLGLKNSDDILPLAERVIALEMSVRDTEKAVKLLNAPKKEKTVKTPVVDEQKSVYFAELERKSLELLGHRVKIIDGGEGKRKIEINYTENSDLEELLLKLCGPGVFDL